MIGESESRASLESCERRSHVSEGKVLAGDIQYVVAWKPFAANGGRAEGGTIAYRPS